MITDSLLYNPADTICAVSTPHGSGGIAVVRVSGSQVFGIISKIWKGKNLEEQASHTVHLGYIIDYRDGSVLDHGVATVFRGPASFTGEDVVELSIHGSLWIQKQLIDLLVSAGCRAALPGEFTRRAFASGRLDLAEAEAVADVIAASSRAAHRLAVGQMRGTFSKMLDGMRGELVDLASLLELELDFSEEDVEFASRSRLRAMAESISLKLGQLASTFTAGQAIKSGIPIAILGKTNAGKSSLLNALVGDDRAIVSEIHGTTRDIVEDTAEIGPYLVRYRDTAGLRDTDDPIESMGIERSRQAARKAEIILFVIDSSTDFDEDDVRREIPENDSDKVIFVLNKTDIATDIASLRAAISTVYPSAKIVETQARSGLGIKELRECILAYLDRMGGQAAQGEVMVTNVRHAQALTEAAGSLKAVVAGLDTSVPIDFIAQDLRQAIHHLSTITGAITTPELLQNIFRNFCIGK